MSFSSLRFMASLVIWEWDLKSCPSNQKQSSLAMPRISCTSVESPMFCRQPSTSVKSPLSMVRLAEMMMDMAKQHMKSMRLSQEKMLSQMRRVSQRAKSWANSKVIHRKQQKKGSILSFSSRFQTLGSMTTNISLISLSLPQIPFSLLSRSLMCSSMMSVMALLNMRKQLASSTADPGGFPTFTRQKIGARISFMPCTYRILGFSLAQTYKMRDMQSYRQVLRCSCLSVRNSWYFSCVSPWMSLNFSLRGPVKKGIMIWGALVEKNESQECVREVSFQICSHRQKSLSSQSHRQFFLFMMRGQSGNLDSGKNNSMNSMQVSRCFLLAASHSDFTSGRQPRITFQQYYRRMGASSGMPSARNTFSFLISTTSWLSMLTRPYTFLAMTAGSPSVSNLVLQGGYWLCIIIITNKNHSTILNRLCSLLSLRCLLEGFLYYFVVVSKIQLIFQQCMKQLKFAIITPDHLSEILFFLAHNRAQDILAVFATDKQKAFYDFVILNLKYTNIHCETFEALKANPGVAGNRVLVLMDIPATFEEMQELLRIGGASAELIVVLMRENKKYVNMVKKKVLGEQTEAIMADYSANKLVGINNKLRELVDKSYDMNRAAFYAYGAYLNNFRASMLKFIFKTEAIDVEALAKSFGFPAPPRVKEGKFLKVATRKERLHQKIRAKKLAKKQKENGGNQQQKIDNNKKNSSLQKIKALAAKKTKQIMKVRQKQTKEKSKQGKKGQKSAVKAQPPASVQKSGPKKAKKTAK